MSNTHAPSPLRTLRWLCAALLLAAGSSGTYAAMDPADAKAFLKENDCTKCHSVTKTKKGPSYRKIAAEFKDDPDAMDKLYKQVTTGPMVELEDGSKEEHKILEADPQQIRELLEWILSL